MKHAHLRVSSIQTAFVAAVAVFSIGTSTPAHAQNLPSYASTDETVRGRIESFDGKYRLRLRDDRGFVDTVQLRDGTVINPIGLRLAAGQSVSIHGRTNGKTFEASEIDTPYRNHPALAVAPYAVAYPAYGYPAPYAYGPYGYYGYPYRFDYRYRYGYPYRYGYGYRLHDRARFGFFVGGRGFAVGGRL